MRRILYEKFKNFFHVLSERIHKSTWTCDLGIIKADLNNKVRLSFYIIRHVDICVLKIIFKLPNNISVCATG